MTMLEQALALARQGFLVFPIKAGAKAPPLIPAWQVAATTDEKQVTSWWTQWPVANIGIHTTGLCVIDVDPKKGGYESLEKLEKEIELDATLEISTPSGGRHIYYRNPNGTVGNGVDVLGPGLDIRSKGGYVLAPGSHLNDSEGNLRGSYLVCIEEEICDAPPELVERLRSTRNTVTQPRVGSLETDADAAIERAKVFLRGHAVAIQGQGGDHHTFRTICRIRDFGVPEGAASEALGDWNARCVPPWEETELEVKIKNAYSYAQDPAGKLTPEALGFEIVPTQEKTPSKDSSGDSRTAPALGTLKHPSEIDRKEVVSAQYLIKGWLEKQSNAVLFGPWNAGKTFVVLDMAASIATDATWFGARVNGPRGGGQVRPGRVLYLGYEGVRGMDKRLIALREKYPLLMDTKTPFEWSPLIHPLTQDQGRAELQAAVLGFNAKHGGVPDLVVIDPLMNALGGDDSDPTLMMELQKQISLLMKAYKCSVLRVHHTGHGNQERARGHSSLPAGVDTEIRVDQNEISLTKQRDDTKSKVGFRLEVKEIEKDADGDMISTCVVEQVFDNPLDPRMDNQTQTVFDALVKELGNGAAIVVKDIKRHMPGATQAQAVAMRDKLEEKQYLVAVGEKWKINPDGIFG